MFTTTTTMRFVALAWTFTAVAAQGSINPVALARSWLSNKESVYDGTVLVNANETPVQIEYRQYLASAKHHDVTLLPWEQCINERNFEKLFAIQLTYFQHKAFELCSAVVDGSALKGAMITLNEAATSLEVSTARVTALSDDLTKLRVENEKLREELKDAIFKLENVKEYVYEKFRQFTKTLDSWGFWNSSAFSVFGFVLAAIGMGIVWWCKCRVSREERRETQQHDLMMAVLDKPSSKNTTAVSGLPSYGNTTTYNGHAEAKYPSPGSSPSQGLIHRASLAVQSTFRAPVSVLSHDDVDQQQEGQQPYQPEPLPLPALEQDTDSIAVTPVTPSPLTPHPGSFVTWRQNMQASRDRGRQFMAMHAPGGPMSGGSA